MVLGQVTQREAVQGDTVRSAFFLAALGQDSETRPVVRQTSPVPPIYYSGTTRYARSNVMASVGFSARSRTYGRWGPFSQVKGDPLHAIQSAMFMIGYEPLARACKHCQRVNPLPFPSPRSDVP